MSGRDDEMRGDRPAGASQPRHNGLLPEDSGNSAVPALPADLAAVQADDALLDALRGANPFPEGTDARLTQVLMAWRRDIDTEPMTQLVDTDTALAVVARAQRPEPRRNSVLVPLAAAAAVLVIAFSGVGVGARAAEPGDRLWSLTKVLYAEHARSVEAEAEAREQLQQADAALAGDRPGEADTALRRVEQELAAIPPEEEGRAELEAQRDKLRQRLETQPDTDDQTDAASSRDSESAPEEDLSPSAAPSTGSEASPPGEPPVSPQPPDSDIPTNPGEGTAPGGGTAPRSAPPPQTVPPVTAVPPESPPES